MYINFMLGEPKVTPRVRLLEPLTLMKKLYNVTYRQVSSGFDVYPAEDKSKFLIRARVYGGSTVEEVELLNMVCQNRAILIYEMDDYPKNFPLFQNSKYLEFVTAHAVTCSTEPLADVLREFNPNVKTLKNQVANLLPERNFVEKDKVAIFFGALNRKDAWQDIMPVLNTFAKKYGQKLNFVVVSDLEFFSRLETPHKKFLAKNLLPYEEYMAALKEADISLMPLKDTEFNRCKSDLKFLEATNAGAVALASSVVYEDSVKDGVTGFIYKNSKEFHDKLNILINDREKRVSMAKAAYKYIKRERLLKDHIAERYDFMNEIYERREELYKASLNRLESFLW